MFLTTTGFAVRQAMAELGKRGIVTAPLLRDAGLLEPDVDQTIRGGNPVQHRISAAGQSKFLDLAAEAIGDSALGLHLAEKVISRDVGILFYVVSGGKNIEEALTLFARYHRIANEAARLKLVRTASGATFEVDVFGLPTHSARQNAEFGFAVIMKVLREVAGRNINPTRVAFAHPRNSDLKDFERFFVCPVEFGRASIEGSSEHLFEFSNETLAIPLITADPKLVKALKPFCEAAAKERGAATGTLRSAVEREIEKLLPHGKAQAQNVAKALALSVRTLSRRLEQPTRRSLINYGEASRSNISKTKACRFRRSPGCWVTRDRPRSIMRSSDGRVARPQPSETKNSSQHRGKSSL